VRLIATTLFLLLSTTVPVSAQTTLTFAPAVPAIQSCLGLGAGGFEQTLPFSGLIYQNLPAFELKPGDVLSFDLGVPNDFDVETDIHLAATAENGGVVESGPFIRVVSNAQTPVNPRGDSLIGNFEMQFIVEESFDFSGGGLILRFSNPSPLYAMDDTCFESQVGVTATADDPGNLFVQAFFGDAVRIAKKRKHRLHQRLSGDVV